jgi:Na+/H+ antiporter NhaD/arsenite permease-like protein
VDLVPFLGLKTRARDGSQAMLTAGLVAEGARKQEPLGFGEYLKVGVPLTIVTLLVGAWVLSL